MTRDFDDHRKRRKAWDRGFSIKGISIDSLIVPLPRFKKADLFASYSIVNLRAPDQSHGWFICFANPGQWTHSAGRDCLVNVFKLRYMGEVRFGKDFKNLRTGKENPAIQAIHEHMTILGVLSHVPWMLYLISSIPGATAAYAGFFKWCGSEIDSKQKVYHILPCFSSLKVNSDFHGCLLKFVVPDVESRWLPTRHCILAVEVICWKRYIDVAFARISARRLACSNYSWEVCVQHTAIRLLFEYWHR